MSKSHKQLILLIGLLAVAVIAYLWNRNEVPGLTGVSQADTSHFTPLDVQAPDLRLDLLAKIHKEEYGGSNRDIFNATSPPPPSVVNADTARQKLNQQKLLLAATRHRGDFLPMAPPPPAPLPPVQVPAQFFGFAAAPHASRKVAFFLQGEDVIVVAEGDPFLGNYRLVHIGTDSADVEEMSSGRHTKVPLEQAPDIAASPPNNPLGPQ